MIHRGHMRTSAISNTVALQLLQIASGAGRCAHELDVEECGRYLEDLRDLATGAEEFRDPAEAGTPLQSRSSFAQGLHVHGSDPSGGPPKVAWVARVVSDFALSTRLATTTPFPGGGHGL